MLEVCFYVHCVLQDLQEQKEAKEEELLDLQKDVNEKKSKVDTHTRNNVLLYNITFYICKYRF